jgi:beta-glucanase (GH16 family)
VEEAGQGVDSVISRAPRFTLPPHVENLSVLADDAHGAGNELPNRIAGGPGRQTLDGGPGDDILSGGPDADLFIVERGGGSDVILDFEPGVDAIRLGGGFSHLASFAAVRAAMREVGPDLVLELGEGERLVLRGRRIAEMTAADFRLPLDRSVLRRTFSDEFDRFEATATGIAGNRRVWRSTYVHGDRTLFANKEAEYYADPDGPGRPFALRDGMLAITAAPAPSGVQLPQGLTHTSGLIVSQTLHRQRFGHFEMRALLPAGKGLWPAFWLLPVDGGWPPEIDVMEMLGDDPETLYTSVHTREDGQHVRRAVAVPVPDLSAGFHVFGVSWRPEMIRFHLDGTEVYALPTPPQLQQHPMYMLANLAVGAEGSWPGLGAPDLRGTMLIDWIRAWQFRDLER